MKSKSKALETVKKSGKQIKSYTGHYQMGMDGKVRQQNKRQAEKKGLNTY